MKTLDKSQPQSMIQHPFIKLKANRPKEYNGLVFYYSIEPGKYMWGKVIRHPIPGELGDPEKKSLLVCFYPYITTDYKNAPKLEDKDIILPPMKCSTRFFSSKWFVGHHVEGLSDLLNAPMHFISTNGVLPSDKYNFTNYIRDSQRNEIKDPGLHILMAESVWSSGISDDIYNYIYNGVRTYKRFEEWKKIHFGK